MSAQQLQGISIPGVADLYSFLDRKFPKNERVFLSKLVQPLKHGTWIPSGTLVVMASGDRKLRVKILDKDTPHKGFSQPLPLNLYARDKRVTARYLLWYLSNDAVKEYLLLHTMGAVILRVPRKILYELPIPLPTKDVKGERGSEIVLEHTDDPFSRLIGGLYEDYLLNLNNNRFRTAVVLAGAISELFLYQLLFEQDIDSRVLANDRNLGLGRMLDYVRLLKLDLANDFPMTHLQDIQKKRNSAIHAGRLLHGKREFKREDLECFDQVIKHFGL